MLYDIILSVSLTLIIFFR